MGLARAALRAITREHRLKPFTGSILVLGRQGVSATLKEAQHIIELEGLQAAEIPADVPRQTTIPDWKKSRRRRYTSDVAFFHLLGLRDIQALDYSDYEDAEIIHDLNQPVPHKLHNRFDLIVDGGTIEHVFDVRRSLANIAAMLRPGGRIMHLSPVNNYVNHGFYQFSPTLYYDYYAANQFANLHGYLALQDMHLNEVRPWDMYQLAPNAGRITSQEALLMIFIAEKRPESTIDHVPIQSFYQEMYSAQNGKPATGPVHWLKQVLPSDLKIALVRAFPWLDPMRRPWGMRRIGRW